ncbi:SDR family NAD(P)-dependent oxidoreductase [Paraburkholderia saeva]|uniref:Glucose 1-dehydrogenase 2 n=1 Tax=Paraburkholderia saeva TaxID=2777537 RepID=A0A9N8RWQ2_9BURK|nr:SDR family NAD(P)-dependent oxidoreductase [Paraburkholderia saeva]CAG4888602.1 Glucose 1-dehydrogenase 2 [Paraburkholderia saeva]CAG4893556.1 Glucose 1-dehydrogenase 2 [Paraburkholderia saeva]CAG4895923.1 Glucose 1-dehydrogenase 2 [Paraburkholderia saeva]
MNPVEDKALRGKVAVITGAGRGIGRAIALAYAKAGAAVVCSARSGGEIDETAALINAQGGRAIAIASDVIDYESVEALFAGAVKAFDGVDIVVANAGVGTVTGTIEHSDPKLWKQVIDVNLTGVFHTARAAIPHLRRRGAGKIILMGSGLRQRPNAGLSAYGSSKAGMWLLTQTLALELQDANISVNELIPGPVRTAMTDFGGKCQFNEEWVKEPEDVVPVAMFLASQPDFGPSAQSFSLMRRA